MHYLSSAGTFLLKPRSAKKFFKPYADPEPYDTSVTQFDFLIKKQDRSTQRKGFTGTQEAEHLPDLIFQNNDSLTS